MLEKSLRTSLEMSAGDFSIFFTRPISAGLLVLCVLILIASALKLAPREVREANAD
jgi:putative tricarboxylic transport membrane protein